jgi:hypothetical protein
MYKRTLSEFIHTYPKFPAAKIWICEKAVRDDEISQRIQKNCHACVCARVAGEMRVKYEFFAAFLCHGLFGEFAFRIQSA